MSDIRWKTYGCASAIASTSILSETVKGMTLEDVYKIRQNDIVEKLGGLPSHKIHCSVLGDKALHAAIDDSLAKNNLPSLAGQENTEIICTCLNITDLDLEEAYKDGDRTWKDIQARAKIGTSCGQCEKKALKKMHKFEHLYGK